jgi:hypothetical protein
VANVMKRTTRKGVAHYVALVRLKGHPPQARTFERKTDAKAWAQKQQVEADIRAGRSLGPATRERHTLAS